MSKLFTLLGITNSFILTMRNVNFESKSRRSITLNCFILTMRNVNLWGLVGLVIALIRFILTMRNVNNKYKKVLELLEQFYINYEECKFTIHI